MKNCNYNKKGFTILETLVAISILLISIAGPLTVAEKGLVAAVSAQDQMVASYLAQDLMEYIRNVRDNNILTNPASWLSGSVDMSTCTSGSSCDFDTEVQSASTPSFAPCTVVSVSGTNLCAIYLQPLVSLTPTGYYYTPDRTLGAPVTKFSRAFVIIPENESTAGNAQTAASAIVIVTVAWKTGGVANQVVLRDILFNTLR